MGSQQCIYGLATEYQVSAWAKGRWLLGYGVGLTNECLMGKTPIQDNNEEGFIDIKQLTDTTSEWENKRLELRRKRLEKIESLNLTFRHDENRFNGTFISQYISRIRNKVK